MTSLALALVALGTLAFVHLENLRSDKKVKGVSPEDFQALKASVDSLTSQVNALMLQSGLRGDQ